MANQPEEIRPESDLEEPEGGPVKSFLGHLEDLRWVIIRCGVALVVGMVICMVGARYFVAVLQRPLAVAGVSIELEWLSPIGGVMSAT